MKKKVFSAFLLAGALAVTPLGGAFLSTVASATSNNTVESPNRPAGDAQVFIERNLSNAESGSVVELEGPTTLSIGDMKLILEKGVTVVMKYTYEGVDYVVTIPAGAAVVEEDIPWYGPLYLASRYGNGGSSVTGASYTVQSGDTLGQIAQENGMTLAELAAKNPQISDVNAITVGQQINLK